MTLYQEEMQRKAYSYGCQSEFNNENNRLLITYDGRHLAEVSDKGYLFYESKMLIDDEQKDVLEKLIEDASIVREYIAMYESAPPMKVSGIGQYRQFSECGDIIFGGTHTKYGFMFSSWVQSKDKTNVAHGHYSKDYLYSKENFAVRAGLVNKQKLFDVEESTNLYKSLLFTKENCETLTYQEEQQLNQLLEKLTDAYPHLTAKPSSFEQDDAPQLTM